METYFHFAIFENENYDVIKPPQWIHTKSWMLGLEGNKIGPSKKPTTDLLQIKTIEAPGKSQLIQAIQQSQH